MMYGNHQLTYINRHQFDTVKYMCKQLNTQNLGDKCVININGIKILLSHGTGGGGGTQGYAITRCANIYKYDLGFDVYGIGHLHKMIMTESKDFYINNDNNIIYRKKYYFVNGCFLQKQVINSPSYAQTRSLPNASIGYTLVKIKQDDYNVSQKFFY